MPPKTPRRYSITFTIIESRRFLWIGVFRLRAGMWMVSPCGATYFARVGKVDKAPPGAAHGHLQCPIPPRPGPPLFLRGRHQGAVYLHPARAKDRIPLLTPPAAAPL